MHRRISAVATLALVIVSATVDFACAREPTPADATGAEKEEKRARVGDSKELIKLPIGTAMPRVHLPKAKQVTLENGLRLLVLEGMDRMPTFTARLVFVDGGGLHEPPDRRGLASFTAELLREGTATRSAEQIARELETLGVTFETDAQLSSATSAVTVSALTTHLDPALGLLADVIRHPAFPEAEVARYTSRTVAQLAVERSQPDFLAQEQLQHALYGDHPAGLMAPPSAALEATTRDDLRRFHTTHYRPNAALLVVVGAATLDQVLPVVQRVFGGWPRQERVMPAISPAPPPRARNVRAINRPGSVQTVIRMGVLGIARTDADYIRLLVMNEIVGGRSSSRLFQNLRERNGYTYSAYSQLSAATMRGIWQASTPVRTEVTAQALKELFVELTRIREESVSEEELASAKRALIGSYIFSLERPATLLDNLVTQALYDLPADYWDRYPEYIEAVTPQDIMRIARRIVDLDHLQIAAVGDVEKIRALLAQYGPISNDTILLKGMDSRLRGDDGSELVQSFASNDFSEDERTRFRRTIEQIGDELIAGALEKKRGITWANVPAEGASVETLNFYDGSPGIAYFLLKAYEALGRKDYLRGAQRALQYILSQSKSDKDGLYFQDTLNGVFEGNAGPGYLFLYAYRVTGDRRHLKTAEAIARRIVAVPDVKEKSSPDIISGAAGTGLFLLGMHEATGKALYLNGAERLGNFLVERAEVRGDGVTWKLYGDPNDQPVYYFVGFSHGPAGIGYYLDRLYHVSGDERYRRDADRAMSHIQAIAIPGGDSVKWYHEQLRRPTRYSSQWCHGAPGMNPFFLQLHTRSADRKFLDWATINTKYLLEQGVDIRKNASVCHGIAGNTASLYQMYRTTRDEQYFSAVRSAMELLYETMTQGSDGFWKPLDAKVDYSYMTGLAGVGDLFILLYTQGRLNMFGPLGYGDDLAPPRQR